MAHLQVIVEADTMQELVDKCNLISLKSGVSYQFTPAVFGNNKFYTTYYIDLEMNDVFKKVARNVRSKAARK